MSSTPPVFYSHPQETALAAFLPVLHPFLPSSNPLYYRLQAPHNLPSRHCVFAATFPPQALSIPPVFTVLFADRSRHKEAHIWVYNPLAASTNPDEQYALNAHMNAAIYFLKDLVIPEAPGWPFSPVLFFACLHDGIFRSVKKLAEEKGALVRHTVWNMWSICTREVVVNSKRVRPLPEGYTVGRVPDDQLDIVLSTSSIPRQAATMLLLPSVGLLNQESKLVAWGYIGVDGAFSTLFVIPEERGKGLASIVAVKLLTKLDMGEFAAMGYNGKSGWVHSHVYEGNKESEGVMKSLGGRILSLDSYMCVDCDKF